jgi:ornithine cyclodeaminase
VIVWGRSPEKLVEYKNEMTAKGYNVSATMDIAELCANANLIVTTTPASEPLIMADMVKPGTHITAMGSDTLEKIELDSAILKMADLVVVDSIEQSETRGEIMWARKAGLITNDDIMELGTVIAYGKGRENDDQITISDLTGVAVQDLKIAEAVYKGLT